MKKLLVIAVVTMIFSVTAYAVQAQELIIGGDMTEVSYIEDLGGVYRDFEGTPVDPFEFLADNGLNMARIRLSNNPGKGTGDGTYYLPAGYQDEADCLALAKRAKDAGMGIQFTFNYSDYWSNGERQIVPSKWVTQIKDELGYDVKDCNFLASMTSAQKIQIQEKLCTIIYDYTKDIMTKLKNQGTIPEYVSLGNEINGGMLFPFGNAYAARMGRADFELNFDGMTGDKAPLSDDIICPDETTYLQKFLQAGYRAVKDVSPESQVIIHLATSGYNGDINTGTYTWAMDKFMSAGVVDVLGASFYPSWSSATAVKAGKFCTQISKKYSNKPVMIMETGYNWNPTKKNGYEGQLNANAEEYKTKYPYSQDGHAGYMAELINELKKTDGACIGVLYWDPCMIHVEDPNAENESLSGWAYHESDNTPAGNVVENTTLFDFDGKAIKTVKVINDFRNNTGAFVGHTSDNGSVITATVNNMAQTKKKVNLYIVEYDDADVLKNMKIVSENVEGNSSKVLTATKPQGKYKLFLWNGESLAPITEVTEN